MVKTLKNLTVYFWIVLCFAGCSPDNSDDMIPYQGFADIVINLNLPEYASIRTNGGFKNINGGVKGIILYRDSQNLIYAFERNCSFQPNEACATVEVHLSGLYMTDPCCSSIFDFNGEPTGGPAWRPLNQYETYLNGNQLTITDRLIE